MWEAQMKAFGDEQQNSDE